MSNSKRAFSGRPKRILVKIGSKALTAVQLGQKASGSRQSAGGGRRRGKHSASLFPNGAVPRLMFDKLAREFATLIGDGRSVVLVSSGAVAMGCALTGRTTRPKFMPQLQACAALGQSKLMQVYEDAFEREGLMPAQVLLTHADLSDPVRYKNARAALNTLLGLGAVPVINENDSVSVEEIKFGDNDQLASMVACLVQADLLVLLTDVDGLLDGSGRTIERLESLEGTSELIDARRSSGVGLGGMSSKLQAAKRATELGIPVVIARAQEPDVLPRVVAGEPLGTWVVPSGRKLSARKHWIAYTLKPRGTLVVDDGAALALRERHSSLLLSGVLAIRDEFAEGAAVRVVDTRGNEIARGLAHMSSGQVGTRSASAKRGAIAVHRDDLVLTG